MLLFFRKYYKFDKLSTIVYFVSIALIKIIVFKFPHVYRWFLE